MLSPLNWGLGHVTRTISIIRELLRQNNEVIICCDETQERFYRLYFPELWYVPFQGYPFRFKGKGRWQTDIFLNLGALERFRKEELRTTARIVKDFRPDLLISDQRFGFRNDAVESVIISHQLQLQLPLYNKLGDWMNKYQLNKFSSIWVPDLPESPLSGQLSQWESKRKRFIGWQSRFKFTGVQKSKDWEYENLAIISGPEPYASQFFQLVSTYLSKQHTPSVLVAPSKLITGSSRQIGNCKLLVHPDVATFEHLMSYSKRVISRAGYSTLMDLSVTGNSALLVPTPGQSEQLYLARIHQDNPNWSFDHSLRI
jgi:hypothetical protein